MADDNAVELVKRGDSRFAKRQSLDSFRQEVALNFCPWLASWTTEINLGDDFASHLIDGTPLLLARDFKSQVGSMLRPAGKQWFWHRTAHDDLNADRDTRDYLDWRSRQMMRILFDHVTGAQRALEQADGFFAWFGDAVLSIDYGRDLTSLRLRNWHTKDCVWAVGEENKVDTISRREMVPARVLKARYGEAKLHETIKRACDLDPDQTFEVRHEVLPAEEYDAYAKGDMKRADGFASVWIDVTHKTVLREASQPTFRYVVPRWVTMSHTAYAISPATTIALPDARLIQQQALAILEAAEKQVNPPVVAAAETFRGTPQLKPYTINYYDRAYDTRTGAPLEVLELGKHFKLGVESLLRTEHQITRAFYLDVLRMPDTRRTKSIPEVQFQIDEYVRAALPLFAPMQAEYNETLLREVDGMIAAAGGYKARKPPQSLKNEPIQYAWDNPLTDMMERQKVQMVAEVSQIGQTLAALEAAAAQAPSLKQINPAKALRETVVALGASQWLLSEREAAAEQAAMQKQMAMQQMIAAAPSLAQVVDSGVNAAQVASEIPNPSEPGLPLLPAPI